MAQKKEFHVVGRMRIVEAELGSVLIKVKRMQKAGFEITDLNIEEVPIVGPTGVFQEKRGEA